MTSCFIIFFGEFFQNNIFCFGGLEVLTLAGKRYTGRGLLLGGWKQHFLRGGVGIVE